MCEFKAVLDGKKIFEDVVYCGVKDGILQLRDILGQTKQIPNCHIVEVNVTAERLVLERD